MVQKQRRKGIRKAALLALTSSLALGVAAPVWAQSATQEATSVVNLPEGPLETSLVDLGEQLGVDIFASSNLVRGKTAPAVSGSFTPREALNRVLTRSGLEATLNEDGAFILVQQTVETDAPISIRDGTDDLANRVDDVVVVTGSRIERTAVNAPSPIDIVTADDIAVLGLNDATEALRFVPSLNSSISLTTPGELGGRGAGTFGVATLDLRGLGTNRTLVLVDGRRHVGGVANQAAVDVSSIPGALIERVEVLTGGGSSIYGADAVTGVVNYILKDDFEGVEVRSNINLPTRGDGEAYFGSITMGGNFGGGRGNAVLNAEYNRQTSVLVKDRARSRVASGVLPNTPAVSEALGVDPNFDNVLVQDRRVNDITNGAAISFTGSTAETIDLFFSGTSEIGGVPIGQIVDPVTGEIRERNFGAFNVFGETQGGDGIPFPFSSPNGATIPDLERYYVNALADYDFTDAITGFVEVKYSRTESSSLNNLQVFFSDLPISQENPFIPNLIQQQFDSLSAQPGITPDLVISRNFDDQGATGPIETIRQTFRIVGGFEGKVSDAFSYEVSANYGRTDTSIINNDQVLNDRLFAAADVITDPVTGEPICRSDIDPTTLPPTGSQPGLAAAGFRSFVPGSGACAPLNVFAPQGGLSQEALDFAFQRTEQKFELEQFVINATFTGNSGDFFTLPAGGISYAAGIEYREESAENRPDPLEIAQLGRFQPANFDIVGGRFDVFEGFGEVSVPIVADLPFVKKLSIDGSVRLADYSTVGSTTSFGIGSVWQPIDDLRFRGSFNRAVRAPNINELFTPQRDRLSNLQPGSDPCQAENLDAGSATRRQNCEQLVPDLANFDPSPSYSGNNVQRTNGGSEELAEETADTFTIGLAYTPAQIPGLSIVADYYNIEIIDAITRSGSPIKLTQNCADAATIDNPFCATVTRDQTTGVVIATRETLVNFAESRAQGIDYQIAYGFTLDGLIGKDYGDFNAQLSGTYLIEREDQQFTGFPESSNQLDGELNFPKHFINFALGWSKNNWRADYGFNYQSSTVFGGPFEAIGIEQLEENPFLLDRPNTGSAFVHYIGGAYEVRDGFEVSLRVNNLTDKDPFEQRSFGTSPRPVGFLGRTVQLGVQARF